MSPAEMIDWAYAAVGAALIGGGVRANRQIHANREEIAVMKALFEERHKELKGDLTEIKVTAKETSAATAAKFDEILRRLS